MNNVLKEANELDEEYNIEERVDKVDETLIDTYVISSSSSILVKCIEAADVCDVVYEPTEFANKIVRKEMMWIKLDIIFMHFVEWTN